jgi:hypothetical protein
MKRLTMMVATTWTLLSLLVLASQPVQIAQAAASNAGTCPLATLRGSYDFMAPATLAIGSGTVIAIPEELLYASPAAYAGKGSLSFNGAGKITLNAVETSQGALAAPISYPAQYSMNAGCSATAIFGDGTQLDLKMVGRGEAQTLVSTTPGFVILRPVLAAGQ